VNCRTVDDAFLAGCADGAADPPLSEPQVVQVALLLTPRPQAAKDDAA